MSVFGGYSVCCSRHIIEGVSVKYKVTLNNGVPIVKIIMGVFLWKKRKSYSIVSTAV
jgi:hypothetical protein